MHVTVSTHDNTRQLVVLAVDDELPGMEILYERLDNNPHVRTIFKAVDASEALRVLGGSDPILRDRKERGLPPVDAVFADLRMPGLSGIEMARVIAAMQPAPALVFVTGHNDQAVDAFELGAVDYLLKPCEQRRLNTAVERVIERLDSSQPAPERPSPAEASEEEVIPVELAGTTKLIQRANVQWVEAQGDYARLFTTDGNSHLVRIPLAQLEERWSPAGFVRIHRSYLVAVQLISELRMGASGYTVIVGPEHKELPVSRRHTRELKDRLTGSSRNGYGG
ncbi:LytTR family two component transcriptional regulator [Tamaricihabitans halophyticus]|uniref:LytTR family two component transcriptional regulator n=1 Tax=Tamaricihabitans halophyticus TaxID=1262583 RepID=A0A4R2RBR0_9PSEU|nr:LytTR family DNA-binding domain-containing protein [Tamaricihabitans halophyticus]TCP57161.1 LytTR family two component transcriptional regulator [Tamaricihabitans halophyticus]